MDIKLTLSKKQKRNLTQISGEATSKGNVATVRRINGLLGLASGYTANNIAKILQVTTGTVRQWLQDFLVNALDSVKPQSKSGRRPKLDQSQRIELYKLIVAGPSAAGFSGACWRTPMIKTLIKREFDVDFNVRYLSDYLKQLGFSFQRASFTASQKDPDARNTWLSKTWQAIIKEQRERNAYVLFGDECSFAQWGSLTRTWAPIGQSPVVETRGTRKNYKVFGAIDYSTGRLFSQGVDGKLNGETYVEFLKKILRETRKHIILIQDGAPYHKSKIVKEFIASRSDRLTVYTLPSYSPDYNPIEKLWKKIKEGYTHLHYFDTYESLVNQVEHALDAASKKAKEFIKPLFKMYDKLAKPAKVQA